MRVYLAALGRGAGVPALEWFHRLSIQAKLVIGYASVLVLALAAGGGVAYGVVREAVERDVDQQLSSATDILCGLVVTTADASVRNHLRAIAQCCRTDVATLYQLSLSGEITEEEARRLAADLILGQRIGRTGYVYCLDSGGVLQVHPSPELVGTDISENAFVRKQIVSREGYIEYDWANPGETEPRAKALYMTYFEPWDWIISASSYREEFAELVSVDDFERQILATRFGQTGYPYVMDARGTLIIHPEMQGENIYDSADASGRHFIRQMCEQKSGKIVYPWKNPGEERAREKLVYFRYIPDLDWIIASSSYLEEFYRPARHTLYTSLVTLVVVVLFVLVTTGWVSASALRPVRELVACLRSAAEGDLTARMDTKWRGETGRLAANFNAFVERLQTSREEVEESQARYRDLFEKAVEGVFQVDANGRFVVANPSLAQLLGYGSPDELMAAVQDVRSQLYADPAESAALEERLRARGSVACHEVRLSRRDGSEMWASVHARATLDPDGRLEGIEGFVTDVTERKRAEEAQARIQEELEQRVAARTAELSSWVCELEERNRESGLLTEMSELLQVCRTPDETYPVITRYMEAFFRGDSGAVYRLAEGRQFLESVARWGPAAPGEELLEADDCWGMRKGKPYLRVGAEREVGCSHVPTPGPGSYVCAPMSAHGEAIGLLHVRFGPDQLDAEARSHLLTAKRRLAATLTEHLSLALTNLELRETLRNQAVRDPLTGLYNRRHMEESLAREAARMRRRGGTLGVLMLDVDHFKRVNDTHGHEAGDAVLTALGRILLERTRAEDIACRFGGEEFCVLMVEASLAAAEAKAGELVAAVRDGLIVRYGDAALSITVSVGVAACPEHGADPRDVVAEADAALYRAKAAGRDRVVAAGR